MFATSLAQGKKVEREIWESGLWLSSGCPPSPDNGDLLDDNVPKIVGSGEPPLIPVVPSPSCLTLRSLELLVVVGRGE